MIDSGRWLCPLQAQVIAPVSVVPAIGRRLHHQTSSSRGVQVAVSNSHAVDGSACAEVKAEAMLLTAIHDMARRLNLKGPDMIYEPVFLSHFLLISVKTTPLC